MQHSFIPHLLGELVERSWLKSYHRHPIMLRDINSHLIFHILGGPRCGRHTALQQHPICWELASRILLRGFASTASHHPGLVQYFSRSSPTNRQYLQGIFPILISVKITKTMRSTRHYAAILCKESKPAKSSRSHRFREILPVMTRKGRKSPSVVVISSSGTQE